jgi:hypothetical protein
VAGIEDVAAGPDGTFVTGAVQRSDQFIDGRRCSSPQRWIFTGSTNADGYYRDQTSAA